VRDAFSNAAERLEAVQAAAADDQQITSAGRIDKRVDRSARVELGHSGSPLSDIFATGCHQPAETRAVRVSE